MPVIKKFEDDNDDYISFQAESYDDDRLCLITTASPSDSIEFLINKQTLKAYIDHLVEIECKMED